MAIHQTFLENKMILSKLTKGEQIVIGFKRFFHDPMTEFLITTLITYNATLLKLQCTYIILLHSINEIFFWVMTFQTAFMIVLLTTQE